MKKLLAILLAVLMLGSVTAFADSATVITLADPSVSVNLDGEDMNIDLNGLAIAIAPMMEGEVPMAAVNVLGNGELLLSAAARVLGDRVLLDMEGLSSSYYVMIPETANMAANMDLSGIDVEALTEIVMASLELDTEGDVTTFKLPYTALNELMEALVPALEQVEIEGVDLSEFAQTVAQLKETDSGINIEGSVTQSETGVSGTASYIPVQGGQAADAPVALVDFSYEEGDAGLKLAFSFSAADESAGALATVLTLNATVADTVDVQIAIPDTAEIGFTYDLASGLVTVTMVGEGMDLTLKLTVTVGEGEITVCPAGDAATAINLEELTEEQAEAATSELTQATAYLVGFLYPVIAQLG